MNAIPIPQADSLAKIATVVDAVAAGADTDALIAEAIGVVGRQGAYYSNAASWFGYVTTRDGDPRYKHHYDDVRIWALTLDGEVLLAMTPGERAADMRERIAEMDPFDVSHLSATTAARRTTTETAWRTFLGLGDADQAGHVDAALIDTLARTPDVLARYREAKRVKLAELAAAKLRAEDERLGSGTHVVTLFGVPVLRADEFTCAAWIKRRSKTQARGAYGMHEVHAA